MRDQVPPALRSLVRRRASRRCEYCLVHDADATVPHEPDHIIARKHRGTTDAGNLAWACAACNGQKGTDIASIDPDTERIVRLFHPRKDSWPAHFKLEGAAILPLSPIGRVTEFLLQFNRDDRLSNRDWLLRAARFPG